MSGPRLGAVAERTYRVAAADTAAAVGSGDVAVLATPRLLAWFEAATVSALDGTLAATDTSVGTRVAVDHVAASPVGTEVTVRAEVAGVDGRLVRFDVVAHHPDGKAVAHGRITRVIVNRDRFLNRVG